MLPVPKHLLVTLAPGPVDPDWNPLDHPKDQFGKFIKKGSASFLFGKTKKAVFALQGFNVVLNLNPGDKATKVSKVNGKEWVVVEDANHNFTAFDESGSKNISVDSAVAQAADQNEVTPSHLKAEFLQEVPGTEIEAKTEEAAAELLNSTDGKPLADIGAGKQVALEVNQAAWDLPGGLTVITTEGIVDDVYNSNGVLILEENTNVTAIQDALDKPAASPKVTGDQQHGEFKKAAPTQSPWLPGSMGLKEAVDAVKAAPHGSSVKMPDGSVAVVNYDDMNDLTSWAVLDDVGFPVEAVPKIEVIKQVKNGAKILPPKSSGGKPDSAEASPVGTAVTTTGNAATVWKKVGDNKWTVGGSPAHTAATTYTDASFEAWDNFKLADNIIAAPPDPKMDVWVESLGPDQPTPETFEHPKSGEVAYDATEVHQHKTSPNSYLVKTKADSWLFFDKNGKAKLASEKLHLKFLETNYKLIKGTQGGGIPKAAQMGQTPTAFDIDNAVAGTIFEDVSTGALLIKEAAPDKWHSSTKTADFTGLDKTQAKLILGQGEFKVKIKMVQPEAPKEKAAAPEQPSEYVLPNGTKVNLVPGVTIYETGGNNFAVFNPDGSGVKYYSTGSVSTYIGKKSDYKGWNIVADVPVPKLVAPDLKDVPPESYSKDNHYAYSGEKKAQLKQMTKSAFSYHQKKTLPQQDSPFHKTKDSGEAVTLLASPKFQEMVDKAAVTIALIAKEPGLDKPDKMSLGKDRARFELLGAISRFAQMLQDTDTSEEKLDATWASIAPKLGAKHNTTFGSDFGVPNELYTKLQLAVQSWKFKQGIKDLGFDPDTASLQTLQEYAANKGFPAVGGLTLENAKMWTKINLGDPTVPGNPDEAANAIVQVAHLKVAQASTSIFLKSQLNKVSPEKQDAHDKAVAAQKAAILKQSKNMASSYVGPNSASLTLISQDNWDFNGLPLTDAEALNVIQSGEWKPVESYAVALKQALGKDPKDMSPSELNAAIKARGGNYIGKMSGYNKESWLRAYAVGDDAFIYKLEHDAAQKSNTGAGVLHKLHDSHPGSWGSPQGKAYRQVLADYLAGQEWYTVDPSGSSLGDEDIEKLYATLNISRYGYILDPLNASSPSSFAKKQWIKQFLLTRGPLPQPSYNSDDLQLTEESLDAPSGVDQQAWNLVLGAEKNAPDVINMVQSLDPATNVGNPEMEPFVPENVKKLLTWAKNNYSDSTMLSQQKELVRTALKKRIDSGSYIPTNVPQWKGPSGKMWPLAPGSKVIESDNHYYIMSPDGSGLLISSNTSYLYPDLTGLEDPKVILALPNTMTYSQATADGLAVSEVTWNTVDQLEGEPPGAIDLPDTPQNSPTLLYNIKNSDTVPPELKANAEKLPLNVQMVLSWATHNDPEVVATIAYKLKAGHYSTLQTKPLLDPNTAFGDQIMKGHVSQSAIYDNWPNAAYEAFDAEYGTSGSGSFNYDHAEAIAAKISELFNPASTSLAPPSALTNLPTELQLTKLSKSLGGMHSKQAWTDQAGNEWMSKAFPSDPNSKARVDAEHQANVIGRLFGFRNPETRVMELGGQYSYVQHLKPAVGSLSGVSPSQMSNESLAQAMEEHVLDWLVSNHDSHKENLLRDPNGTDIIGIDKGQAWRFFPSDKLEVGYKASNPIPTWYDDFYKAVQSGSISKEKADFVTKRVLTKALKVQKKFEDETRALLQEAHKNRTNFPSQFSTREKFIDGIMERKSKIAEDFLALYGGLYKKAGWEYDFDLEVLGSAGGKLGDAHLGLSTEFAEDVMKSNTHGKSVMVASEDLEDSHFLFYTEKAINGKTVLRGEARLRENADALLTSWLKKQTVENNFSSNSMNVVAVETHEEQPGNSDWWNKALAGAKTVNHHAADGEYNVGTLAAMDEANNKMKEQLLLLEDHEKLNPDKPFKPTGIQGFTGAFVTKEQQDAWKDMLKHYTKQIDSINAAKAVSGKVTPKISQMSYTPSKGLDTKNFIPGTAPKKKASDENEVISNVVMVGGHPVKVTKHPSYGTEGDFDAKTGILTETGTTTTGFYGAQYDIEVNGVKIEYRPWSEPGVLASQKGLLKVRYPDWDGSNTDPMETVFEVLQDLGLDLEQPDEESLELFYWKQQYGVSLERSKATKYAPMQNAVKAAYAANPSMSKTEQLTMFRSAWALSIGQDKVDKADWTPKFDRLSVSGTAGGQGKPYWVRPDVSLAEYYSMSSGRLPASSSGDPEGPMKVALSGYLPTEERARILTKIYAPGGYNSQQHDAKNGASGFVFTRQNKPASFGKVYYHPSVVLRTTNYAFDSDNFGNTANRKNGSPAELKDSTKFSGGTNELMIKNGIGYTSIAAIRFGSESARKSAIAHYKANGVTEIHGIPVEELFVTSEAGVSAAMKKVWADALAQEKIMEQLTTAQKAAYAGFIAAGMKPEQALMEAKAI